MNEGFGRAAPFGPAYAMPSSGGAQADSRPATPSRQQAAASFLRDDGIKEISGLILGFGSNFIQNAMSHPFIVMRRQCQVNANSNSHNMAPWRAVSVMYTIQNHQSMDTYGKGFLSRFLMQGIQLATENVISEATNLPKEVNRYASLQKHGKHLLLKTIALTITSPLLASSFLETVQSEIGSDRAGVLDFMLEGGRRVLSWKTNETTRLLPIWKLAVPVVTLGLLRYIISSLAQYTLMNTHEARARREAQVAAAHAGASPQRAQLHQQHLAQESASEHYLTDLLAVFAGSLLSDIALYPLETVIHRLLAQGTRIVIDNTDTGIGVLPVTTRYTGFFSCLRGVVSEEGVGGLYKGVGALVAQYLIHAAVIKLADTVYRLVVNSYTVGEQSGSSSPARHDAGVRGYTRHLDED